MASNDQPKESATSTQVSDLEVATKLVASLRISGTPSPKTPGTNEEDTVMTMHVPNSKHKVTDKDVPYTDEYVGIYDYRVGEPFKTLKQLEDLEKDKPGVNFYIVTFEDEPFTEDGIETSGKGCTTSRELLEFALHKDRRWIAQGYKIPVPQLRELVDTMNEHPGWFGTWWPCGNFREQGTSHYLRDEFRKWQQGRQLITAGEPTIRPRQKNA